MTDILLTDNLFPTLLYVIDKPEYLQSAKDVSEKYTKLAMEEIKEVNDLYPVVMSPNFFHDESILEFSKFISQKAWEILKSQGYAMDLYSTIFYEMWCQNHYKYSSMEQHSHNGGSQIVGFYFLEVPENSSRVVFHDPKPAKVQVGFAQENESIATASSNMINYAPKEGQLMFTNAWLPHSFTKHNNEKPFKFIHFTLGLAMNTQENKIPNVEVV